MPYNGWTFFHIDLLERLCCLFEMNENKQKKRPGLVHFLFKFFLNVFISDPFSGLLLELYDRNLQL